MSGSLPMEGLSHLVIEVGDLDAAEAFYRDGLGMKSLGRDAWPEDAANAVLAAGGQRLVLVRRPVRPDLSASGVHQAYRISAEARAAARGRLEALGFTVETYREDRPAEARDNFYVFDPSGNRAQLVVRENGHADGTGITGIDHACLQDYDLQWTEAFYARMLGMEMEHVTGLDTADYVRAQDWGAEKIAMAPGCCRLVRYYRQIPGQNRMQPRPTLQMYFRAGDQVLGVYMAMEDYAEPPEEQLTGTPRTGLRVAPGGLDAVARRLEAAGRPFQGPMDHAARGGNIAPARALYCRAPGGNFIEFCEA